MRTFRARLEIDPETKAEIAGLRPEGAPSIASVTVEEQVTLFELAALLRDALAIPDQGYSVVLEEQDYSYQAFLELPEGSGPEVRLIYGAPSVPGREEWVHYLAPIGGTTRWNADSRRFTVADLTYSQGLGLAPETDTVVFRIERIHYQTGADGDLHTLWDQLPQLEALVTLLGAGATGTVKLLSVLRKNQRKHDTANAFPKDVVDVARERPRMSPAALARSLDITQEDAETLKEHHPKYYQLEMRFLEEEQRRMFGQEDLDEADDLP